MTVDQTTPTVTSAPFEGKTLAVTAPSRQWVTATGDIDWPLRREAFAAAQNLGFRVRELPSTYQETARFAGSDDIRARDFVAAMTQTDADLVMAMRGGYGAARLLDLIDWQALEGVTTPMVGFSDFTALNLAYFAKTNQVSWQGPTLRDLINPDPLTLEGLATVLGLRPLDVTWCTDLKHTLDVTGTLWGGNLAVLTSLVGTPYLNEHAGDILFIEDVAEPAYRIERMLMTLKLAGVLDRQKLVIVGDMQGADRPVGWTGDFSLAMALDYLAQRTGVPFVTGLPFGHIHRKCSLPVGGRVRCQVQEGMARLSGV